ncbi:hypothetical protein Q3G72_031333 [Acer saccharum]|nr:hypothetical protein Q3G72_020642 [Acer saccharum]KAK1592847.1 hypothetical protein Q3G72_031333 [Acer saccharum]
MIPQPQPNIDHIVRKMDRQETRDGDDGEKWMDNWDRRRQMARYGRQVRDIEMHITTESTSSRRLRH